MRFGVLGTLVVIDDDGAQRRLSGPARRRLLAALVARAGHTVPIDTLVEDLWAGAPPATAERTLQSHVVRLRDDLGRDDDGSPIVTESAGYRLQVELNTVDSWCFERDLTRGHQALATGDLADALALLDQAVSWWRGEAYAEFPDAMFAVSERLRLHEMRALAFEERTDAALGLGAAGELVGEIEQRLLVEPFRERSWAQLVLALYRSGRQGDALAAHRRARTLLVDELGLEPSPGLRRLEQQILNQDPSLDGMKTTSSVVPVASPRKPVPIVVTGSTAPELQLADIDQGEASTSESLRSAAFVAPACPYRGLGTYGEGDAELFFGRERLAADLAGRLVDNDLLVVVGPSGSGKSSLVRAGLIPALRSGAISGSSAWRTAVVTPGTEPASSLEVAGCELLVIDQAEEIFTLTQESSSFHRRAGTRISGLLSSGTRIVLVIRGDFYGRLAEFDVLTGRIGSATVLVGPMSEDEIRRVIVEPATRQGVDVEAALVTEILDDVAGRAGALPLLSAALERTWFARTGDRLTVEAYRKGGGVHGAMEAMAEKGFAELSAVEQVAARRVLLRLATLSGGSWVRRPLALGEFDLSGDAGAARAVEILASNRLITVSTDTIELTHEALLTGWPRLREWLDERAVMAEQLEHLRASSLAWQRSGRSAADLIRGPRLQAGLVWRDRHPDDLSATEVDFLDSSQAAIDAELADERSRRRRLTVAVAVICVVALLASGVGYLAYQQKGRADVAALEADVRRLVAESYQSPDSTTAQLLAATAFGLKDTIETQGALQSAVQRIDGAAYEVPMSGRQMWVGAGPDGSHVFVADSQRNLAELSPASRSVQAISPLPGYWIADVSPGGEQIVTCGDRGSGDAGAPGKGPVTVVDTKDGTVVSVLPTVAADNWSNRCGRFTLDGRWYVLADTPHAKGQGDALAVYDAKDWSRPPRFVAQAGRIGDLAAGTSTVAVRLADGTVKVLDADTLATKAQQQRDDATCTADLQCFVAITPDGETVAFNSADAPQMPVQLPTSDLAAQPAGGEGVGAAISAMSFSYDGARLASGGFDGSLLIQTTSPTQPATVQHVPGGGPSVSMLSWAGTGVNSALYTVGSDRLTSWLLNTAPRTVQFTDTWPASRSEPQRSGEWLVSPQGREFVLTNTHTGANRTISVPAELESARRISVSGDGSRVALSLDNTDGSSRYLVVDTSHSGLLLDTSVPATANHRDLGDGWGATVSPDGRQLALPSAEGSLSIVDVDGTGGTSSLPIGRASDGETRIATPWGWTEDGKVLIETYEPAQETPDVTVGSRVPRPVPSSHSLITIDPNSGRTLAHAELGLAGVQAVETSPEGRRLAVATAAGMLHLLDSRTLEPLVEPRAAQSGPVRSVSWSPDGDRLLTSGIGGDVNLWDAKALARIGDPIPVGGQGYGGVLAWYSDPTHISGVANGTIEDPDRPRAFIMPGAAEGWLRRACEFVGRDMTAAEWANLVGDRQQIPVCSTLPS